MNGGCSGRACPSTRHILAANWLRDYRREKLLAPQYPATD